MTLKYLVLAGFSRALGECGLKGEGGHQFWPDSGRSEAEEEMREKVRGGWRGGRGGGGDRKGA